MPVLGGSIMAEPGTYSEPRIEDFGTLIDLTAAFDPDTLGDLAKGALSMAAVSVPMSGGGTLPGTGGGGGGGGTTPTSETLGQGGSGGGSTPGTSGGGGGDSGGSAGAQGSGAGGGPGGGGSEGGGSDGGGRLPFSGFSVILTAALGAVLAGGGARARSVLRRKPD